MPLGNILIYIIYILKLSKINKNIIYNKDKQFSTKAQKTHHWRGNWIFGMQRNPKNWKLECQSDNVLKNPMILKPV